MSDDGRCVKLSNVYRFDNFCIGLSFGMGAVLGFEQCLVCVCVEGLGLDVCPMTFCTLGVVCASSNWQLPNLMHKDGVKEPFV